MERYMADVRVIGMSKRFEDVQAVRDLDLAIDSGEFIVLLGPSGAGKTTTLRLIAGLDAPDSGQVHIDGRDVTAVAPALRDVTFVFQQYSLYPHLSVYDNLAFPLRSPMHKTPEDAIKRKVLEIAQLLRIEDKLQNSATRLSGGQMQRVAIGRALVRNPALYLMDEPLSSLDAKLRNDLRLELKRIQHDVGATMLYVTHDQTEALTMATRVGVLQHGVLVQVGTPRQIYEDPISAYVASRLGTPRINLVARSALGALAAPPNAVTAGIRSEHLRPCEPTAWPPKGALAAQVMRIEHLSDQSLVHALLNDSAQEVVCVAREPFALEPGRSIHIHVRQMFWFDAAGRRIRT
jgi:multiple sugar transport system ATP-binding protein